MGGGVEHVGLHIHIQPAVAVVITEGGHARGIRQCEAARRALFLEGAVTLVDEKQVGHGKAADVDVEKAVVVDVGERHALPPGFQGGDRVRAHPGLGAYVLELPAAQVAEEPAAFGLAGDQEVGATVVVVVADRDTRADGAEGKFLVAVAPHARVGVVVLGHDAGLRRRQQGEEGGPARGGGGGECALGELRGPRARRQHEARAEKAQVAKGGTDGWGHGTGQGNRGTAFQRPGLWSSSRRFLRALS